MAINVFAITKGISEALTPGIGNYLSQLGSISKELAGKPEGTQATGIQRCTMTGNQIISIAKKIQTPPIN